MLEFFSSEAFLILVGTLFGGVGLKVVEKWLNKSADNRSDRQEFRSEIKDLNDRIDRLEQEVDDWRVRFYKMQEQNAQLRLFIIKTHGNLPDPFKGDQ